MKALWLRELDLADLPAHIEAGHASKAGTLPSAKTDAAREHARWHNFLDDHDHEGETVSVVIAPGHFSVNPIGRFTGRDMKVRVR